MQTPARIAATLLFLVGASGCITHLPMRTEAHLRMPWAGSFDAAVVEATRTGKPILACLVAGKIDGAC